MRVDGVQERSTCNAIRPACGLKSGGIVWAGIAADDVVTADSRVVRIVDAELSVVENIESLSPELERAALRNLEMFGHRHVEVKAAGIIEEVAAGVAEGESSRGYKL